MINGYFHLKLSNLSAQETGIKLQEKICSWQTSHFNATELCVDWLNENDNRVRKIPKIRMMFFNYKF